MKNTKIGFIGGGNMATSLIKGLINSGHSPSDIWVADVDKEKLNSLATSLGVNTNQEHASIIAAADVVVLAVKPQILKSVAVGISRQLIDTGKLLISIAAGIKQQSLAEWLGAPLAIVRCMPNTPALVLTGATALHANDCVSEHQKDMAENILRAVGLTIWLQDESKMDAVTAVSGSGPAYFFLLMEAMQKAAKELDLQEDEAALLVQQTALGAAKIALESDESAEQLRRRVTSPGGTTEQAINAFLDGGFVNLVKDALQAAHDRSVTMSRELGEIE